MKNTILSSLISVCLLVIVLVIFGFKPGSEQAVQYTYKQFSTIESVVPGGFGRSRIISTNEEGAAVEKELENFFSLVGINFSNVAKNDKLIVDKLNEYTSQGWELYQITSGASSSTGKDSGSGIFITRYLFRKSK